jgi:hypothetical protein
MKLGKKLKIKQDGQILFLAITQSYSEYATELH